MLTSFAFFFFLLSSYFVLRPMRDEVAAASGVRKLPWLFAARSTVTLLLNPMFSGLVVRVSRAASHSDLVSVLRRSTSLVFYVVLRFVSSAEGSTVDVWMGRAFFVWTTVFALFNTSIFWCLMADVFKQRAGEADVRLHRRRRHARLDHRLGVHRGARAEDRRRSTCCSCRRALIELAVFTVVAFPAAAATAAIRRAPRGRGVDDADVIGGSVWAGFTAGRCARRICSASVRFMCCSRSDRRFCTSSKRTSSGVSTPTARRERRCWRSSSWRRRSLTVMTQIFFTGRIIRWLGLGIVARPRAADQHVRFRRARR